MDTSPGGLLSKVYYKVYYLLGEGKLDGRARLCEFHRPGHSKPKHPLEPGPVPCDLALNVGKNLCLFQRVSW